jgi:aminopeptidase N
MQTDNRSCPKIKRFELPGSIPHYPKVHSFSVSYMVLKIKPDLNSNTLDDCIEELKITAYQDINEIILDVAEIDVHKVMAFSDNIIVTSFDVLKKDDKMVIKLSQTLQKGNTIDLTISYSAGFYCNEGVTGIHKPRSGFYFVSSYEHSFDKQAWTQGEALESKYWFPCQDDPRIKFPREIHVTVPENDFIVISNGELAYKEQNTWIWKETHPTPAYLTSIVIGKFAHAEEKYHLHHDHDGGGKFIPLLYYWPKEIPEKDALSTFANTPHIMRFFERYFDVSYPYSKYSQVAVEEFEFGGMENTSCTTLTRDILHDKIASIDYTRDVDLISHELAHQWFGNLVTCADWSNLWLNEGFATYCEALYWESVKGFDELCYKVIKMADGYLEESRRLYERSIVTRIYKHPDDLFDAHSYDKGACVLHMLRHELGENNFRRSIKDYLSSNKNKVSETDDLCKTVEKASKKSMRLFFDQWVYRSGHPIVDIEFSLQDSHTIKCKIYQIQQQNDHLSSANTGVDNDDYSKLFAFNLDIKIVFSSVDTKMNLVQTILVSKRISEHSIEITDDIKKIEWISIDPQFKILKEVRSIKITNEAEGFQVVEMLKNQLSKSKEVVERIDAARALKNHYSVDIVNKLQSAVTGDRFYGVAIEAANTLGSYYKKDNYDMTNRAYNALVSCINNKGEKFCTLHPEIKQAVVRNIGQFRRKESVNLLEPLLHKHDESYFVRANAATSIAKSIVDETISPVDVVLKERTISELKEAITRYRSFREVIATGAIEGLKELSNDKNRDIIVDIANFLLEKTDIGNDYFIRLSSTYALSKFLYAATEVEDLKNPKLKEMNQKVFYQLLKLLKDKRRKIKINACKAFADEDNKPSKVNDRIFKAVEALIYLAEHDLDGFVRREAERCANILRVWIGEWSEKPISAIVKLRE